MAAKVVRLTGYRPLLAGKLRYKQQPIGLKMEMSVFAKSIMDQKYAHTTKEGIKEEWNNIAYRVTKNVMKAVGAKKDLKDEIQKAIEDRKFIPGGRYLSQAGRTYHQTQNCLLLRAEDSREGWSELLKNSSMALMTGAGIGVDYSRLRAEGKPIRKTGGTATGPIALMEMINEMSRGIMAGGSRRGAVWAGLAWDHADVQKFIGKKNWSDDIKRLKANDFSFPAPLDGTNISVQLNKDFFDAYDNEKSAKHGWAHQVYSSVLKQMLSTAEPGFSVDYDNPDESLRNACTEIVSEDDSDICNLGSINLARVESLEEMQKLVELGTAFLLAGTVYSDVPYVKVDSIRSKNRRLGLGLMGIHEWLLVHNKKYGPDTDLEEYLKVFAQSTKIAETYADAWELSKPIKTRAIAPNGSIGIVSETTTGLEPIYCVAYKRRYLKGSMWAYQYVIDPTARRLIEMGINPEAIEDAYSLADNVERRVETQAWLQTYVDHAISSTINLPSWGSEHNNESKVNDFGKMLMKHLKGLRGVTVYPDGARSGQPLTPVQYKTALKSVGEIFYETVDICDISKSGTCG